jgi:hypothetical protein
MSVDGSRQGNTRQANERRRASPVRNGGFPMRPRRPGPPLTKAELRAQGAAAVAAATKPIEKLPTKVVRQCGRCGEFSSVMVDPGQPTPEFTCKVCDRPERR